LKSRFPLTQCDRRQLVWRRHGKQYMPNVVQEVSVMMWGGISIDGYMDLIVRGNLTALGYIEQMLLQHVLVPAYSVGPEFILMHDNARAHVARITRAVLRELDIQEMEWPAVSPDLNPIEHVWDRLNRSVHGRPVPPQTLQDLEQTLVEEWNLIPQRDFHRLIRSMSHRCHAVINAHGGLTPY
jgi:Transposase and inactivated derivatives